ncbi:MAG: stage III sporulation protein AB [Clostridia bacterium]|nr:stage III sporulation protein AB [Clostridia bacterium]
MIKILGIILIFIACYGFAQKRITKSRKKSSQLSSLISGLKEIADKISFLGEPLYEIISSVNQHNNNIFFSEILSILSDDKKVSMETAWKEALESKEIALSEDAKEVLLLLGKTIGRQTAQKEEENIGFCIEKLSSILAEEEQLLKKNTKMIQSLGIVSGLAIVILFV